jgi:hypothetical protein
MDFVLGLVKRRGRDARPGLTRVGVFLVGGRASGESECGRGTLLYGAGRGRGVPVEGTSYESEPERGRGTPSSYPHARRTWCLAELGRGLVVLIFIIVKCGYPYTIGTDSSPRAFW